MAWCKRISSEQPIERRLAIFTWTAMLLFWYLYGLYASVIMCSFRRKYQPIPGNTVSSFWVDWLYVYEITRCTFQWQSEHDSVSVLENALDGFRDLSEYTGESIYSRRCVRLFAWMCSCASECGWMAVWTVGNTVCKHTHGEEHTHARTCTRTQTQVHIIAPLSLKRKRAREFERTYTPAHVNRDRETNGRVNRYSGQLLQLFALMPDSYFEPI